MKGFGALGFALALAATAATGSVADRGAAGAATSNAPGTLIAAQLVPAAGIFGTAYQVQYWSESVPTHAPVKVSGLVIVPDGPTPGGGWPVVSWGHGTDGMVSQCASSLHPAHDAPLVNTWLRQGFEVVASDYLNENAFAPTSKSLLPYLVGADAARNVIDIVRAARQIPEAAASASYIAWGLSEGAQAALFVSHIAEQYAPELTLEGAVAVAPPSQMNVLLPYLQSTTKYWPLALMIVAGYNSAYGNTAAPLGQVLTATGTKLINTVVKTRCANGIFATLTAHYTTRDVFKSKIIPPAWKALYNNNDPAGFRQAGPAPVLIAHGNADPIFPASTSNTLAGQLCALSPPQHLQRWLYTGPNHSVEISLAAYQDITQWMSDRFAGDTWPDPYTPTANGTTKVTKAKSC